MKQLLNFTIVFVFLATSVLGVLAHEVSAQSDPCESDRAKYCPQYEKGNPLRLYCLKTVESQVEGACKGYLRNIQGGSEDFIEECTSDYHKFCENIPQGKGRILECLRKNSKSLDFECRKKVNMIPR